MRQTQSKTLGQGSYLHHKRGSRGELVRVVPCGCMGRKGSSEASEANECIGSWFFLMQLWRGLARWGGARHGEA